MSHKAFRVTLARVCNVTTMTDVDDTPAARRQRDIAFLWAWLEFLGELWAEVKGDPPPGFRPDDGPALPVPPIRRLLWPALRNEVGREWFAEVERLLAEDESTP